MALKRITLGRDTSGRPLVLDERTLTKLRHAEAQLGFTFTIVQGSYRGGSGAQASAGTHDRGGVIDLRTWNLPSRITPQDAVLQLRKSGLIAWYRTNAQGFDPHIHAIDYGNPELAPSAARQVTAWEAGRNGLASNGPDDGPRVNIPKDPPGEEMNADQEKKLDQVVAEVARIHKRLDNDRTWRQGQRERIQRLIALEREGKADRAVIRAQLEELEASFRDDGPDA